MGVRGHLLRNPKTSNLDEAKIASGIILFGDNITG